MFPVEMLYLIKTLSIKTNQLSKTSRSVFQCFWSKWQKNLKASLEWQSIKRQVQFTPTDEEFSDHRVINIVAFFYTICNHTKKPSWIALSMKFKMAYFLKNWSKYWFDALFAKSGFFWNLALRVILLISNLIAIN